MMYEVPTYDVKKINPKKQEYCVCVFVINEGVRIQDQLKKMQTLTPRVDIIVCDGGSTDGSLESDFLQFVKISTLLTKTGPGKLSAQMRMGFDFALKQGYKGIITIDGNGKDGIESIPHFVQGLEEGYDHIQGSRYIPGGVEENTPRSRHYAVKFLHAPLISLAAEFHYTDTTNGFRAYSKRFLEAPQVQPFRNIFDKYELHYYLAIRAAELKFRVKELPVSRKYPKTGGIPTKISPISGNLLVLKTLFKACLKRYNPPKCLI